MRKKYLLVIIYAVCLMMTGCSADKASSVKKTVGEVVRVMKESIEEYNRHKDIEVHT